MNQDIALGHIGDVMLDKQLQTSLEIFVTITYIRHGFYLHSIPLSRCQYQLRMKESITTQSKLKSNSKPKTNNIIYLLHRPSACVHQRFIHLKLHQGSNYISLRNIFSLTTSALRSLDTRKANFVPSLHAQPENFHLTFYQILLFSSQLKHKRTETCQNSINKSILIYLFLRTHTTTAIFPF